MADKINVPANGQTCAFFFNTRKDKKRLRRNVVVTTVCQLSTEGADMPDVVLRLFRQQVRGGWCQHVPAEMEDRCVDEVRGPLKTMCCVSFSTGFSGNITGEGMTQVSGTCQLTLEFMGTRGLMGWRRRQ